MSPHDWKKSTHWRPLRRAQDSPKHGAECKPTGRKYRTVDELVDAECADKVKAEYYRLRAEEGNSPSAKLRCCGPEAKRDNHPKSK